MSDQVISSISAGSDLQDFYLPFDREKINPVNMQTWPYYKYVSAHWEEFVQTSIVKVAAAKNPARLKTSKDFDLNTEFRDGKSYLASLVNTLAKGFVVIKDDQILAEFYDNGFYVDDRNLLQSSAKTLTAVIVHKLIDAGKQSATDLVQDVLPDFESTDIGPVQVQHILDQTGGYPFLLDFHTPGTIDFQYEIEIGLKPGKPKGHVNLLKNQKTSYNPGEAWQYTDMNTDLLALIAEKVSGMSFAALLSALFNDFRATGSGYISLSGEKKAAACYGIGMTVRDYALFHQWIAQGKAPKSYYASATDKSKDLITKSPVGNLVPNMTYGSQSYFSPETNVLFSSGSFGQVGASDLENGVSVVVFSDWAVNIDPFRWDETLQRAIEIIKALRI